MLIGKLLSAFPPRNDGGSKDEMLRRYIEALDGYALPDIAAGIDLLIRGKIPGVTGDWPVYPPQVSSAVRRAMNERLDSEERHRKYRQPQLRSPEPPPPTAESRARVKAMVEGFVNGTSAHLRTEDAERDKRHDDLVERTHKRFAPKQDPESVVKRLAGPWYGIGNDAEEEAA